MSTVRQGRGKQRGMPPQDGTDDCSKVSSSEDDDDAPLKEGEEKEEETSEEGAVSSTKEVSSSSSSASEGKLQSMGRDEITVPSLSNTAGMTTTDEHQQSPKSALKEDKVIISAKETISSEADPENDTKGNGSHSNSLDQGDGVVSEKVSSAGAEGSDNSSHAGDSSSSGNGHSREHSESSGEGSSSQSSVTSYSQSLGNSSSARRTRGSESRLSPGRRRPGRGLPGRGPGRGRGFGSDPGQGRGLAKFEASLANIHNERTAGGRRQMLSRAATERFHYKRDPEEVDMTRPRLEQKSLSFTMGKDPIEVARQSPVRVAPLRLGSIAFGRSKEQAHYTPKVIRKSDRIDVQTGGTTHREVICQRIIDYPHAMNPAERRRKLMMRRGDGMRFASVHGDYNDPQFRLQSRLHTNAVKEQMSAQIVHPGALTQYLIWSLRSNFIIVLLSEALAFWTMICVFATCIYLGAYYQPACLRLREGIDFEEGGAYFIDAFALSWTTFSTVGYGMVHPEINREQASTSYHCAFMTTIVALEAFVGVLFASFCGAVIVGKVTRAKSTASVKFSQRICLRFGSGVMCTDDDDDRTNDSQEKPITEYEKRRSRFPCPVLEFRLSNTLFDNANGEIMNSKLSVVCSTLLDQEVDGSKETTTTSSTSTNTTRRSMYMVKGMANQASQFLRNSLKRSTDESSEEFSADESPKDKDHQKHKRPMRSLSGRVGRLQKVSLEGAKAIESALIKKRLLRSRSSEEKYVRPKKESTKPKRVVVVDEDPTEGLVPKRAFTTLNTDCDTHPFFKRVWTIRHVLNADSPILTAKAKKLIREKRGMWPREACNSAFIRENLSFQQLIVSLSGTTCVNGCNVYGLHVYEYRDLHIGYTFAPIAQMDDGRLVIDLDSIDNVREQRGGGAEPINYYAEKMAGNPINKHDSKEEAGMCTPSAVEDFAEAAQEDGTSTELRDNIMASDKDILMELPCRSSPSRSIS